MAIPAEEIVRDYKEAKNKKAQIKILAQQALCSEEQIVNILTENGIPKEEIDIPKKGRPKATGGSRKTKTAAVPEKEKPAGQQCRKSVPPIVVKAAAKEMVALQEEIDRLEENMKILSEFLQETQGEGTACS